MPLRAAVHVTAVDSVALNVADMDRSIDFYTGLLMFNKKSDTEISGHDAGRMFGLPDASVRIVRLQLGDEAVELRQFIKQPGKPYPPDTQSNDRWFQHIAIVVSDMPQAYDMLERQHVENISIGPQQIPDWNIQSAGIRAFYFKDPDGHPIELIWFPDGKGNPKWHRFGADLFMGIDHTAVVVSSTPQSLDFYRDELGLSVVAESDNSGIEQERLSNVAGTHVHITSLRADDGFGIELLDYSLPLDGRSTPGDIAFNDMASSQTEFVCDGVPADKVPYARDPDGHAILFITQ